MKPCLTARHPPTPMQQDANTLLADLRRLLTEEEPSHQRWDELILYLEHCDDEELLSSVALPYCEEHLASWPNGLRAWPGWWFDLGESLDETPPSPLIGLIRHIEDPAPSREAIKTLATTALLSRVTSWVTTTTHYKSNGNIALSIAHNPHLSQLQRLELDSVEVGDEGAIALANAPHLANLSVLHLDNCWIGTVGAAALATSKTLAGLRELSLKNLVFAYERDATTLANTVLPTLAQTQLTGLDLSGHRITGFTFGSPPTAPLQSLSLMWCGLSVQDATQLTLFAPTLTSLSLSTNALGDGGIAKLAEATWPNLKELNLTMNHLTKEGMEHLVTLLRSSRLTHLELGENPGLGNSIAQVLPLATLHTLLLNDTGCGDSLARTIANQPESRSLRVLDMSGNPITDQGAQALASSPHLSGLKTLRLMECQITDRGQEALSNSEVLRRCVIWVDRGTSLKPLWS